MWPLSTSRLKTLSEMLSFNRIQNSNAFYKLKLLISGLILSSRFALSGEDLNAYMTM